MSHRVFGAVTPHSSLNTALTTGLPRDVQLKLQQQIVTSMFQESLHFIHVIAELKYA
jgi:hypothetical protein